MTAGLAVTAAVLTTVLAACDATGPQTAAAPAGQPAGARGPRYAPDELGALEAPDRLLWQQPDKVMDVLNIADGSHVADVGAGGGWFTTHLARRVGPNGLVYAVDIQPALIEAITRRMKNDGLTNVRAVLGAPGDPRLPSGLQAVLLVDSYPQLGDPVALLRRVSASLAPGGRIGIVNFKNDGEGGPGPRQSERVAAEDVKRAASAAGLTLHSEESFLRYQYMLVFTSGSSPSPATPAAGWRPRPGL
jgi:SAM-dependent methyltransferase